MAVSLQIQIETALALHGVTAATEGSRTIQETAKRLGVDLVPIHPGRTEPDLAPYFTIDIIDPAVAEQVATRLRECPGVQGAYVKPEAEPA